MRPYLIVCALLLSGCTAEDKLSEADAQALSNDLESEVAPQPEVIEPTIAESIRANSPRACAHSTVKDALAGSVSQAGGGGYGDSTFVTAADILETRRNILIAVDTVSASYVSNTAAEIGCDARMTITGLEKSAKLPISYRLRPSLENDSAFILFFDNESGAQNSYVRILNAQAYLLARRREGHYAAPQTTQPFEGAASTDNTPTGVADNHAPPYNMIADEGIGQ